MTSEIVFWLTIKPRMRNLQRLLPEASVHPTGSRYVCNPPVLNTDIDFLVFCEDDVSSALLAAGYKKSNYREYFSRGEIDVNAFAAWRRGKVNLIVTSNVKYAETFHTATYICKQQNVEHKYQRVTIHEVVRGTMPADHVVWNDELKALLASFQGEHGHAIHKLYRVQHGLVLRTNEGNG